MTIEGAPSTHPIPGGYTAFSDYEVTFTYANGVRQIDKSTRDETIYGGVAKENGQRNGLKFEREGGQLFLDSTTTCGMPTVISTFHERSPVGAIKWMYEVTNVVADWRAAAEHYTRIFGLDSSKYVPIEHADFGYIGTLTLFDAPARLDRIEISQPTSEAAMGRFHRRNGDSLYMFYVEADNVEAIADRLREREGRFTPRREGLHDGLWIHPTAFCGVLVGVSRTDVAWRWSGNPERGR